MTTIFFSHNYQLDFLKYINWDMQTTWRGFPGFLSDFNVVVKLYSIAMSRYSTLFGDDEVPDVNAQAQLKQKVFMLLAGRFLDDDKQDNYFENLKSQIDRGESSFSANFIENIPTIVKMMKNSEENLHSSIVRFIPISKSARRLHFAWKILGLLDSFSALVPSLYFGVLTGYLWHQRQPSAMIGFSLLGFLCKIPCVWVYFMYRVPSNAEFVVWLHSFATIGLPKLVSRRALLLLSAVSFLTATVDASTIFYPSQNALRYYCNATLDNIQNPVPVGGNKATLVLVVSEITSILYAITSFGNTLSSSLFLLFISANGRSQRCCRQPLSILLGMASIAFSQMIGVFSLLNLFQVLKLIDSNENFSWSVSRIMFSLVAFFLALLPTYKSYRYTLPKVLKGAERLLLNRCACLFSFGESEFDGIDPDLEAAGTCDGIAEYHPLSNVPA